MDSARQADMPPIEDTSVTTKDQVDYSAWRSQCNDEFGTPFNWQLDESRLSGAAVGVKKRTVPGGGSADASKTRRQPHLSPSTPKATRKLSLLARALSNTRKISLSPRKQSAPAKPMEAGGPSSKSYSPSPEKSPSKPGSSLLLRKISSAKYKLTKSSNEPSSADNMCKFHARIMKFRRKMVCNCSQEGPKVFQSVSEMGRSQDPDTFCKKCSKPTQMLASSCTQTALKQCYMVDKLFNDAAVHETFGARFLGHESLPNSVMKDAKRNTVIKAFLKKYEKPPKEGHLTAQTVFLSIEGESFIVTNVASKQTVFAHSLDSLPLWSVGGNKSKLLALVLHQSGSSIRESSTTSGVPSSVSSSYTIFFFKCDGDAKGVAEALQKSCMNTRRAIRTSANSTPKAPQETQEGKAQRKISEQMSRRSYQESIASANSECVTDSEKEAAESVPNLRTGVRTSASNEMPGDQKASGTMRSHVAQRASLNQIDSGSKEGGDIRTPFRSATFSQSANSLHKRNKSLRETYEVQYNGFIAAPKADGLDITNSAIEQLSSVVDNIYVTVTPASITMRRRTENLPMEVKSEQQDERNKDDLIAECKLRYLSFYAIGKNINKFAFICATPEEQISHRCYVVTCDLGAGKLAQSFERACKTRISHAKAFTSFGKHGKFISRGGANEKSSDKPPIYNPAKVEKISDSDKHDNQESPNDDAML